MRSSLVPIAVAVLVGIGASLLGQLATPYHLLTDEFIVWACGLGALVLVTLSHAWAERGLPWLVGLGLAYGAGAFTTHEVLNAAVHDCTTSPGQVHFWSTWAPLCGLAAVLGHGVAQRSPSRRWWLSLPLLLGGISLVHDVGQLLAGVRIVDPFIGVSSAYDQRASMGGGELHALQRLWLVGVTVLLALGLSVRRLPRWPLAMGAVAAWFSAGQVGLGWSGVRLYQSLSATVEQDGVVVRYDPQQTTRSAAERVATRATYRLHRMDRALGLSTEHPVTLHLFNDFEQLEAQTGRTSAHAGYYWVHLTVPDAMSGTLTHELVHALEPELGLWVPTLLNRGHIEGFATAWATGNWQVPETHDPLAAALQADVLPRATEVMTLGGFVNRAESSAYSAASSFVGWLMIEFGTERYLTLRRNHLDYEATYGSDLATLDARWRAFLAGIDTTTEQTAEVWGWFSSVSAPGYVQRRCPKTTERTPTPESLAMVAAQQQYVLEAARYWKELAGTQPHRYLNAVTMLQRAGAHAEALATLERWEPDPPLADAWWSARIDSLIALEQWEPLEAALDARAALGVQSPARTALASLLRDPEVRTPAAAVLARRADGPQQLQALLASRPDDPGVHMLWFSHGGLPWLYGDSIAPATRLGWQQGLALLRDTPQACELTFRAAARGISTAMSIGELAFAHAGLDALSAACRAPDNRYTITFLRDELAWHEHHGR